MFRIPVWKIRLLVVLLLLGGGAVLAYVYLNSPDPPEDRALSQSTAGFRECAQAAGIKFRM
jgi:hypothetical protein